MGADMWTEAQARKARQAWIDYCKRYEITGKWWLEYCEEFVQWSDAKLLGYAQALDFGICGVECFGHGDLRDFDAVRDVLTSRGYDVRTLLRFCYRDRKTRPFTEEEIAEEGGRLA